MNDMILSSLGQLPEHRVRKVDVDIMTIRVGDVCSLQSLLGDVGIHTTDAGFLRMITFMIHDFILKLVSFLNDYKYSFKLDSIS